MGSSFFGTDRLKRILLGICVFTFSVSTYAQNQEPPPLEKKIEILELQYHKDDKTVEDHNQILDNYNFIQK